MKKNLLIVLGLMTASQAFAADEYTALLRAKKFAEVEKLATAKLAQEPGSVSAMAARTSAIMGGDEGRIEEAVKQAEQCVALQPKAAPCHEALGSALGTKAMSAGIMAAMGYIGTIKESFLKAVELDPKDYSARYSLLQFYMMAPRIAGGGMGKAEALAKETAAQNPDGAKLMLAVIAAQEDELAKAEAGAMAIKPGSDEDVMQRHEDLLSNIAGRFMRDNKFADAERVMREAQKRYPDSVTVPYMAGRVQQELGKHKEALALFEQTLAKYPKPWVHYRMAQSLKAMGDKAKAIAAYEKATAFKAGLSKKMREDAEVQLKALKT
ncbi:MAG: tetratricopeptide repeat protein [Pseudomonadota bacterium]